MGTGQTLDTAEDIRNWLVKSGYMIKRDVTSGNGHVVEVRFNDMTFKHRGQNPDDAFRQILEMIRRVNTRRQLGHAL